MKKEKSLLIGAHTSAAGGVFHALMEGKEIGATTIQLFTANQKQWHGKPLTQEAVSQWKEALKETGIESVMSHDSYLINLGGPREEVLTKSRSAFREEIERCLQLGLTFLNFHPGASLDSDVQESLDRIVESLLACRDLLDGHQLRLLLETTAGQGSSIGHVFEQLAYIVDKVEKTIPIGVCIDTCHIFAAGYDIRTKQAWEHTLVDFDKTIGLKHLYAFHINDSVKGLASRVDRHANLGEGEIGWECFRFLMQDERVAHLPKYLETPGGPPVWKEEIKQLREYAHKNKNT